MQVLPFVFALIMLFSLTVGFFFHNHLNSRLFHEGLKAKARALQETKNNEARLEYRDATRVSKTSKPRPDLTNQPLKIESEELKRDDTDDEEELDQENSVYFRNRKCKGARQKFNLALLQKDTPDNSLQGKLFEAAGRIIKKLYQHTAFYIEGCESDILAALLIEKNLEPPCTFSDPVLDKIFYQMQRGTSTYDVITKEGFPSFWDYFSSTKQQTLNFSYLSSVVLEEIIDPRLFKMISTQEKKTNKPLSNKEIKDILAVHPEFQAMFLPMENIFVFSKKKDAAIEISVDEKSGMVVRD